MGYQTSWMSTTANVAVPEGRYTLSEYFSALGSRHDPYFTQFKGKLDHLTFLGMGDGYSFMKNANPVFNTLPFSAINHFGVHYDCDVVITLMDTTKFTANVELSLPVITWLPYHYSDLIPADLYLLRKVAGVASLAPTMSKVIEKQLFPADVYDPLSLPVVRPIPHIIAGSVVGELPPGLRESARSFFGLPEDTFVVLQQGGNYEKTDRKGWNQGIQAFAEFYHSLPSPKNAHLYIHAIGSTAIAETEKGATAPANVMDDGVPLVKFLRLAKVPQSAYTIDQNIHTAETVVKLKTMANVCLHASKTEGFGLNSLECQALGTPVITTNFSAMGDYTKLGKKVEPNQMEWMISGYVATPDVKGIASALREIHAGEIDVGPVEVQETRNWVRENFSVELVGNKFAEMIEDARERFEKRGKRGTQEEGKIYTIVRKDPPPAVNWDTPWTWALHPDVEIDEKKLDGMLHMLSTSPDSWKIMAVLLPTRDYKGGSLPLKREGVGDVNPLLPVVVNTHIFANAQSIDERHRHGIHATVLSGLKVDSFIMGIDGTTKMVKASKEEKEGSFWVTGRASKDNWSEF